MARITVQISDSSRDDLVRLADREYRDARQQAKYLLEQAIHERSAAPGVAKSANCADAPAAVVRA